ncbi:MAG: hypothetical protein ACI9EF_001575 [Pseudohongiellaceae bacterium]|jgi:hypothetical protein
MAPLTATPSGRREPPVRSPALRGSGPGWSGASRLLLVAGLLCGSLTSCAGLSKEETDVLSVHLQNSTLFYQQGSYRQALHQASMALLLEEDHVGMQIIKGFCLTKLGAVQGNVAEIDNALELFDDIKGGRGGEDYRTWLGSGEAHTARAVAHQQEFERSQRRLASDFLTADGRDLEEEQAEEEAQGQAEHLALAERDMRRVFTFPLHADNTYALLDLIVIVNMDGDREDESVALCRRATKLLVEGIELTRETLNNGLSLSPSKRVSLQQRVEKSLSNERQLRQILVTIEYSRGSYQRCLAELNGLEERQLITAADHLLRAGLFEKLGMLPDALDELDVFLRIRSRLVDFDQVASNTLQHIEELRATIAASP